MPCRFAVRLIMFVAAFGVAALTTGQEHAIERSFAGQTVRMDLSVGDYRVAASPDDRIRVTPLTKNESESNKVSVRLDVNLSGTRANLRVRGPQEGFEARIELPKRVNIVASLPGGSLRMGGVEGSKDIEAKTGDIEINVGDRDQYKRVIASVRSGDLTAPAFDDKRSGPHSFEWTGKGPFDIRIRLDSGRLTLR